MKCIDQIPAEELKGKRVFLRTSLNLPIAPDGSVGDLFRLERGLPTLRFLVERGARVIVVGYLGRKGDSMRPVAEALMKLAPDIPMRFLGSDFSHAPQEVAALANGECLILESTRRHPGEETNDPAFIELLASLADIYVSDAFAEAHRDYASNVGIAKRLPSYAGLLLRDEVQHLSEALTPSKPSLVIIGGAKFETKEPVIEMFMRTYDHVFVVGAIGNDILKARGFATGRSKVSEASVGAQIALNPRMVQLADVTVETPDTHARVKKPDAISPDEMVMDMGPDSVSALAPCIAEATFILWNGPTGVYEKGYLQYTRQIAQLIAARVSEGARCVIGGGDTIAAIDVAGVPKEGLGFLSTGGGAMLDFLVQGSLPAIKVLG